MIYVIATLNIKPNTLDQAIAASKPCIEATRNETGCIRYDLNVDVLDPTKITFVERWENREALEAHFHTPHIEALRQANKAFVTSSKVEIIHTDKVETL